MNRHYPIILGHKFRKGILISKAPEDEGYKLAICRLKKDYQTGDKFDLDDVESIEQEIWFSARETVQTIINALTEALEKGETH